MANRERNFLDTARSVIFANPAHPYHYMFRLAGCSYEDLERRVHREGLESTLAAIHRAGVWLSHDEFKGKKPIVRSGQTISASSASFLNPLAVGSFESSVNGFFPSKERSGL